MAKGDAQRVSRAVSMIYMHNAELLRVNRPVDDLSMALQAFINAFCAAASLSRPQFREQLWLIEARRMMSAEGKSASTAVCAVGYGSLPQFTREYARQFGVPPVRGISSARARIQAAA